MAVAYTATGDSFSPEKPRVVADHARNVRRDSMSLLTDVCW